MIFEGLNSEISSSILLPIRLAIWKHKTLDFDIMITVYSHSFAESPITHCWIQIHSWLLYPTEPLAGLRLSWMFRWICPPASLTVYCRLCSSAAADVRTWAAAIQEPGTWGDVWRWRSATLNPAGHGWPSCNDHLQCWRGDRWGNRLLLSPRDPPPPKRKWQRMCLKAGGARRNLADRLKTKGRFLHSGTTVNSSLYGLRLF